MTVTMVRAFADGRILFQRDGTYFTLTHEDVAEVQRLAAEVRRVQGPTAEPEKPK